MDGAIVPKYGGFSDARTIASIPSLGMHLDLPEVEKVHRNVNAHYLFLERVIRLSESAAGTGAA